MAQINKPNLYFNTKLYTGNGSTQSITGVGFQPDLTWIKRRDGGTTSHQLFDSIRGVTKRIFSDTTAAEDTNADTLTAFETDGFTVGSNTGVNPSGNNVVAWNWLGANGTASNTDGSITSTVSANTTSGFSIVSYTGTGANATVGHGLGVVPKIVLVKRRSDVSNWCMYNVNVGNTKALYLNNNTTGATSTTFWNDTTPTSSVFTVGSDAATNGSSDTQIAYCFAEKNGYSKFGSYTGNASSDGIFIYTGFKPAFAIFKNINAAEAWNLFDNKRIGHNGSSTSGNFHLNPDSSAVENVNTGDYIDFLSNGIKIRTATNSMNVAQNYIYMAFAEQPLVGTNNIPATAR